MAAGLGFKTFTTGEVLTAADTNGYLMQGINVFASTAARDAAITSPQEGQFAFTKDTNGLWYYDGAAWVASGATGDIEGVTAGTGISGGGTSGTVTITNSMATEIAAKGDLIVGTGAATFDNLAAGANGETLVANSAASSGLTWASPVGSLTNPVINGGMDIWQRGTSTSIPASTYPSFPADRWITSTNTNQACTVSQQATGDTTNLPNIQYALRYQRNSGQTGTGALYLIENFETATSIPYAGKTITLSFYARKGANYSATSSILVSSIQTGTGTDQNAFLGYTGAVDTPQNNTLTTSWQRFTQTLTIGATATEMSIYFLFNPTGTASTNDYYEITGVQIDVGTWTASTAPTFRRSGGTIQGELAACQRYYWRAIPGTSSTFNTLNAFNANFAYGVIPYPVTMRTNPTLGTTGVAANYRVYFSNTTTCNAVPANGVGLGTQNATLEWAATGGCSGANAAGFGWSDSGGNGYLEFKAEL